MSIVVPDTSLSHYEMPISVVPRIAAWDWWTTPWTMMCWAKVDAIGSYVYLMGGYQGSDWLNFGWGGSTEMEWAARSGTDWEFIAAPSPTTPFNDKWVHYAWGLGNPAGTRDRFAAVHPEVGGPIFVGDTTVGPASKAGGDMSTWGWGASGYGGEHCPGRYAYMRLWFGVSLSHDQIRDEMLSEHAVHELKHLVFCCHGNDLALINDRFVDEDAIPIAYSGSKGLTLHADMPRLRTPIWIPKVAVPAGGTPVSQDVATAFESLGGLSPTKAVPTEQVAFASQSADVPDEQLVAVQDGALVPVEQLEGLGVAKAKATEQLSQPAAAAAAPTEQIAEAAASETSPTEQLAEASDSESSPWESRLTGSVQQNSEAPFESLGGIDRSGQTPTEQLFAVAKSKIAPYEQLAFASSFLTALWEALGFIPASRAIPFESIGAAQASLIALYEWAAGVSLDASARWESLRGLSKEASGQIEMLADTLAARVVNWESTAELEAVANSMVAAWESLRGLERAGVLPWESDGVVLAIRERLLRNLEQTMLSIQAANGFGVDVQEVQRVDEGFSGVEAFPAILIREVRSDEDGLERAGTGLQDIQFRFEIGLWVRDDDDAAAAANALLLDVEAALSVDPERAGLAEDTTIDGSRLRVTAQSEPYALQVVDVVVHVRHDADDPFEILGVLGSQYGSFPISAPSLEDSVSVRERIVLDLVSTAEGITTANGYRTEVFEVDRAIDIPHRREGFPTVFVVETSEVKRVGQGVPTGLKACDLNVVLHVWEREADASRLPGEMTLVLAELKRALMVDPSRGGRAISTEILTTEQDLDEIGTPLGLYRIGTRIRYRHAHSDPSAAR